MKRRRTKKWYRKTSKRSMAFSQRYFRTQSPRPENKRVLSILVNSALASRTNLKLLNLRRMKKNLWLNAPTSRKCPMWIHLNQVRKLSIRKLREELDRSLNLGVKRILRRLMINHILTKRKVWTTRTHQNRTLDSSLPIKMIQRKGSRLQWSSATRI